MARSAYGFDTGPDTLDWWHHAACRSRPDMWFASGAAGEDYRKRARHICEHHCPVLADCRADAERAQPTYGVQAGVLWTNQGGQSKVGEPARYQPADLDPTRCPVCSAPARAYRHQKPTAPSTVLVDA